MTITDPTKAGFMSDEERAALAAKLGYKKIGKELPDNVTLNTIVQSMPKEVRRGRRRDEQGARMYAFITCPVSSGLT